MLIELRAKNCFIFGNEVEFSMQASENYGKFPDHVNAHCPVSTLKVAGLFGQNNTGKTCLIKCLKAVKSVLEKSPTRFISNFFLDSHLCELAVRFSLDCRVFEYVFHTDAASHRYVYERFCELNPAGEELRLFFLRDHKNQVYECADEAVVPLLPLLSTENILIYLLSTAQSALLTEAKDILTRFAALIEIVDMNNIPLSRTIDILKNKGDLRDKVVNFVRNADLYLDDISYLTDEELETESLDYAQVEESPAEKVLHIPEQLSLVSVYNGKAVPSLLFDSTGTKKIAALASYIIEGLAEGKILMVDEIDSSIHFKLSRAIVSMFNNELNERAQLIFTAHDVNLIDCERLFRPDQVWFIHKDEEGIFLYSLADFGDAEGVNQGDNMLSHYKRGILGALPAPQFINSLLELAANRQNTES